MAFLAKALFRWDESLKNADEQLSGKFFRFFLCIGNFTKYYLHAKFQINWTIPTEITEGGRTAPLPPAIPILEKPGLFRVKLRLHDAIYRLRFYPNALIYILSVSNVHSNVASIQKN